MAQQVECSPMIRETWFQSQVASYQRLQQWFLMPPCLTLSNIRYVSRGKWSNPGKGVALSPTPQCSSCWKRSLLVALDYGRQLNLQYNQLTNKIHSPGKKIVLQGRKAKIERHNCHFLYLHTMDICRCLPPDRTWHKVNDYGGDLVGRSGTSLDSNPAGLCCSSTH